MKQQHFLIIAISVLVAADRAGAGTNSALDFAPKTTGTTQDAYVRVGNPVKLGLPRPVKNFMSSSARIVIADEAGVVSVEVA